MMLESSYVAWCGTVLDEPSMMARAAVSPAANRWQDNLIRALQQADVHVSTIGHVPEPVWPRGRLLVTNRRDNLKANITGQLVDYLNFPYWRAKGLSKAYIEAFDRSCDRLGLPTAVITYNPYPHNCAVGLHAQKRYGIPWVAIVADAPGTGPKQREVDAAIDEASGRIFLSWGSYSACQRLPKLHLDGGISRRRLETLQTTVDTKDEPFAPIVLYTGTMNQYGGVDLLARAFRQVKNPDVGLWLCGRGSSAEVESAARVDQRIKIFGLVTDEELDALSKQARIFVNPRPSTIADNRANFPSKILEYLSYGKPVVSTWTEGLSSEYRDVLVVLEEETPACLAQTIEGVLNWQSEQRRSWSCRVAAFLDQCKTWDYQALRLREWLKNLRV